LGFFFIFVCFNSLVFGFFCPLNVDTTATGQVDHASSNDVGYIYLNPVDTVTSLDVTFGGAVQINQGNDPDITQLSYTVTVDIV